MASVSPEKLRSKSIRGGTSSEIFNNFDDSKPFEIRISNPASEGSSEKEVGKKATTTYYRTKFRLKSTEPEFKGPTKMYYKSVQSKMVSPKTKNPKTHKRRGSMRNLPAYNIYDLISTESGRD